MQDQDKNIVSETSEKFLVFLLGGSCFAMPLLSAKEVIAPRKMTCLPATSQIIKGIINLRGKIITMIDLRTKMGILAKVEGTESTSFIILDDETYSFGIIVNSIETVLSISQDQIEQLPTDTSKSSVNHVNRLAKVDNKLILILNIEELIKDLNQNKIQAQRTA